MHEIRVATAADAEEVGRIRAEAFADDPVLSWACQGDHPTRIGKLRAFFEFWAVEVDLARGVAFLADGACACWVPPPGRVEDDDDRIARLVEVLTRVCDPADLERLGILGAAMEEAHPSAPHWYLSTIATVPERWGQGVGAALLGHSLALVDADAAPAYLESTNPRNVSLYERHGFTVTDTIPLLGGPSLIAMWRAKTNDEGPV